MRIRHRGSSPILILLLVILLLLIILAVLGRRSLVRERNLLLEAKGRQARLMTASLASAMRVGLLLPDPENRYLANFANDTAGMEGVLFAVIYDQDGRIIISSGRYDPVKHGLTKMDLNNLLAGNGSVSFPDDDPEAGPLLVSITRFSLLDSPWLRLRMLEIPPVPGISEEESRREQTTRYAVIGLSLAELNRSVADIKKQIFLYGFLLLFLGTIGFYFLILVQTNSTVRRALADEQRYTLDLIEGMSEGLISVDHAGIVRAVNPVAEGMLRIRAEEKVGSPWREVFGGEELRPLAEALAQGRPFHDREVFPRDPLRAPLAVTMTAVHGLGGQGGWVLFLRNMEELKSLREEVRRSERLAALGRMVAGMAHEIRNPLNSIRGFSQHLAGKLPDNSGEMRAVEIIIREVDRLNRVITELLDFSRPKELDLARLDLNEVVRSCASLMEREAVSQGVKIVEDLAGGELLLRGDLDGLKQLLLNLLLNALQAMPEGGVLGLLTAREERQVAVTVSDTGPGIAEEDVEQIFEPFFTTKKRGTGLGLAIVHRIVQDHGGEIRVKSAPGRGTSFLVRFPALPASGNGERPSTS